MSQKVASLISFISLFLLIVALPAWALVRIDPFGSVLISQPQVLSSSDEGENNSGSGSSGSSEDGEDTPEQENEAEIEDEDKDEVEDDDKTQVEIQEKEFESQTADGQTTKVKVEDDGRVKTEIRLIDGTKIKTRTDADGRTRTDVYSAGNKVRLEREDGRFRIKTETETEGVEDAGEDDLVVIDERSDKEQIRLHALQSKAIIERLQVQALTDLPLAVNLDTNELTVTTPAGEKVVTVLPDQAVQNMLAANVIDRIGADDLANIIREQNIETLGQVIELAEQDGLPVYEIHGLKEQKLLGFFRVTTNVNVTVSAETGEVIDTNQSLIDTLLSVVSVPV